MREPVIALDLGGTKVAGAVVDGAGRLAVRMQTPTPVGGGPEAVMEALIVLAHRLRNAYAGVTAVGVGSAGQIDRRTGRVIYANENLPGWTGMEVGARLAAAVGLPVAVDNDVNVMAIAEATLGAGAGRRVVIVVAVGTGIGGGLVVDGRLFRGADGLAGALGHIPLTPGGPRCACGNRGCLEAYAAGPRIAATYMQSIAAQGVAAAGEPLDLPAVLARARAGDRLARGAFAQAGRRLGQALAGLVNTLNPDAIVLGGGVMAAQDLLMPSLQRHLAAHTMATTRQGAAVLPAALGTDAGLIGAALIAQTGGTA